MLAETLAAAREAGFTRIELTVYDTNAAAIALYRKHGFIEEGRKRRARVLDGRVDDMVCMALLF
jgi:RimJ/RimL family protein N-acetyltransferase